MKRASVVAVTLLLASIAVAASPPFQKKSDNSRLLTGKVSDHGDAILPNAVVYLSNTRTRAVKTYIVGQDGTYRFPSLSPNIDYEVYAEHEGARSDTKTLSGFDSRRQVSVTLKIKGK